MASIWADKKRACTRAGRGWGGDNERNRAQGAPERENSRKVKKKKLLNLAAGGKRKCRAMHAGSEKNMKGHKRLRIQVAAW